MILVDTSIWIDHLHQAEAALVENLHRDEVGTHELVIEELALGSIRDRVAMLGSLETLYACPRASHHEVRSLVESRELRGSGLSAVDAHLLASVLLVPGAVLWTRDKRLRGVAESVGAGVVRWR